MPEAKLSVGNVDVLPLTDMDVTLPLNQMFPDVPLGDWAPYQQRYPHAFSGDDAARIHMGGFLLRSQGRTILVDTGIGSNATNPGAVAAIAGGVDGRLLADLEAAGLGPEEVDTVFFTHLHPDHVGWNLAWAGGTPKATFPKARYVAHQADWDAWRQPEVQGVFPYPFWNETVGPLEGLGVLDLVGGEHALPSEITAFETPGHTPGSMSLAIVSGDQRAYIVGDVLHGPAQVTETDWVFHYDMDKALAVQTRSGMIDRVEAENAIIVACHHVRFGRVVRAEGRRYWQAW